MCKSKAAGGQRCAGHAKARVDDLRRKADAVMFRYDSGTLDEAQARAQYGAAHEALTDAQIDYASTVEGAATYRDNLSAIVAFNAGSTDPHAAHLRTTVSHLVRVINDGALRAQANREAENAHRATQGKKPLTTPVPQTFAQQDAASATAVAEAEAAAAKAADPLGLRAATEPTAATRPATPHFLLVDSKAVIDKVATTGGLTVSPTGAEPTTGYCINEVGACPKIPEADFFNHATGHQALDAFLTDHADWFNGNDANHIGIWHDKENGVVVLDRVDVITSRDDALRIGRERRQRSIWDVERQAEIPLT